MALFHLPLVGFSQFSVDVDIRTRLEYRDGYKQLPTKTDNPILLALQRNRLTINYKTNKIDTRFSFLDAGIWGEDELRTNSSNIRIQQAWAKYYFSIEGLAFKIGRQEIKYDDERLLMRTGQTWELAMILCNFNILIRN